MPEVINLLAQEDRNPGCIPRFLSFKGSQP
jgi:hypothetical protein